MYVACVPCELKESAENSQNQIERSINKTMNYM